jgi:octaheme c-type cytochrome (tetrathionate reductase family)
MRATILAAAAAFAALLAPQALPASPDHSRFAPLQREFASGPEVTQACLACHPKAAKEVHRTEHWKWEYVNPAGQKLGKRHVVNNFCTSTASNLAACASCHVGYGMKDAKFDFASEANVDCLVCHDTTGKYKKPAGLAGNPVTKDMELPTGSGKIVKALDLKSIAQHVGRTSRATCGTCHFYGGGGDGVKHGDMDSSLEAPDRALDVHMDVRGLNFSCTTCHRTENHAVPGSRYGPMGATLTCDGSCHGAAPHPAGQERLNAHTAKVACQTCHIPAFARGGVPTKMVWDWSTAGQRGPDGKPLVKKNAEGYDTYNGMKGDFTWASDVKPEYLWFNGSIRYTLADEKLDPAKGAIWINRFEGSAGDGKSKIWPVKIFRATQAWDPVNRTLAVTHLAGNDEDAYWKNLDWVKAVAAGMKTVGAPFSGQVAFIETYSTWPITHMVAPKTEALKCADCHSAGGRLAKVPGISVSR